MRIETDQPSTRLTGWWWRCLIASGEYAADLKRATDGATRSLKAQHKAAARNEIQKKKFWILVNIGDQASDLDGGSAVKRVKVPNPMYFTP
jgi:hypothetical protein